MNAIRDTVDLRITGTADQFTDQKSFSVEKGIAWSTGSYELLGLSGDDVDWRDFSVSVTG